MNPITLYTFLLFSVLCQACTDITNISYIRSKEDSLVAGRKSIDLSNHNLESIPDSVFSMTHLEYLQLGNNLTIYPPLSALPVEAPNANRNKITEIPNEIENLEKLRVLGLCYNDLRSIPQGIVGLEKLDTLDLSFNECLNIKEASKALVKMPWLKCLNIVGTNADSASVAQLRRILTRTRVVARFEDIEFENLDLPE